MNWPNCFKIGVLFGLEISPDHYCNMGPVSGQYACTGTGLVSHQVLSCPIESIYKSFFKIKVSHVPTVILQIICHQFRQVKTKFSFFLICETIPSVNATCTLSLNVTRVISNSLQNECNAGVV